MSSDQFAVYRVDPDKNGWAIKGRSYRYVKEYGLELHIDQYRQFYQGRLKENESVNDVFKKIRKEDEVTVNISDVLLLNRKGEMISYYIDEERLIPIYDFIRPSGDGNIIGLETRDHVIEGKAGSWDCIDMIIMNGRSFYLMENQKYPQDAMAMVLDSYGRIIADQVKNGFDEEIKEMIRRSMKDDSNQSVGDKKAGLKKEMLQRMHGWQKRFPNDMNKQRSEAETKSDHDRIHRCADDMSHTKKPVQQTKKGSRKRKSVIRRLRQKQIDIAKRSGRPIPMYLQETE